MREKDFCSRTSGNPTVKERQRERKPGKCQVRRDLKKTRALRGISGEKSLRSSAVKSLVTSETISSQGEEQTTLVRGDFLFTPGSAPYMSLLGQTRALSLLGWKVHQKLHLHQPVYQNSLMFVSGAHRRSKQCLPHPQNMLSDKLGTPLMPEDTFLFHPNKRGTGTHPTMSCSLSWS